MYTVTITKTRPNTTTLWYHETVEENVMENIQANVESISGTISDDELTTVSIQNWYKVEDFKALVLDGGDPLLAKHKESGKTYMAENNITSEIVGSGDDGDIKRRFNPLTKVFDLVTE